jgi:Ca2+-binding EF-hand superfamily protein
MTTSMKPPAARIALCCALIALIALTAAVAVAQDADRSDRARAADFLRRADADGDGKVTKAEFVKARTAELEEGFARIDADGDGILDEAEAERVVAMLRGAAGAGRESGRRPEGASPRGAVGDDVDGPFQRLDRDGDGKLSREEFAVGMARMREMMQQRGGMLPGQMAGRGGGPAEGFRRPPEQDGGARGRESGPGTPAKP